MRNSEPLADIQFEANIIEWRGPAPYLFVPIPEEHVGDVRYAARLVSYGWGVIPVDASIGSADFSTSLFPKDGGYLLPLKVSVQRAAGVGVGDRIKVRMRINDRPASSKSGSCK